MNSLCKAALDSGGIIQPLLIPFEATGGTGLMNPSVYDTGDELLIAIRHINYVLYHAENRKFPHTWGPLQYINPENDQHLRTKIFIAKLDRKTLEILAWWPVNMALDNPADCEFIGLEDARLFNWNGKLYLCGVRRDADVLPKGEGRMELSEIVREGSEYKEVSRRRLPIPTGQSYCEKNWIPILDRPYDFVKWVHPVEIVHHDLETLTTKTIKLGEGKGVVFSDLRGGSQAIPYKAGYLAVMHETIHQNTMLGRKDATYRHRFVQFSADFDVIATSELFDFMGAKIEFCCGLAACEGGYLLSFGFQDNAAYIMRVSEKIVADMLGGL